MALKEECCSYADKAGLVENNVQKVRESLQKGQRDREKNEAWYKNWFSASPLLPTFLPSILGPFIGLLLLLSFRPWVLRNLTDFIKAQVDLATKRSQSITTTSIVKRLRQSGRVILPLGCPWLALTSPP